MSVVNDTKFWLDNFMKTFTEQETSLKKMKVEIQGEVEALKF